MSYISKVPYRCPKCGDLKSFPSLRELKMHLDEEHSFRSMQERQRSRVFTPLSKQKYASRRNHSGRLSPLSLSLSEDARALEERLKRAKEAESAHRLGHSVKPNGHNHLNDTITMLSRDVMQARQNQWNTADALYHSQDVLEGLQLSADQQSKQQTENVAKLKNDLEQKERNLSKVNKDLENVTRERIKLEAEKLALAQRMEESSGKVTNLESQMREKTEMLKQKDREHKELMKFLEGAARKESVAREKLKISLMAF
ncbi:protein ZNF365-like [Liolophura sinensis]|uniref:protein ZNF365-like n=1 Tax=Liolophura sinensis TaxID=3198878 RepID=UPI0031591CE4